MDCATGLDTLTADMIAIARLAIAGGVTATGLLVVYGIMRTLNRWRRYDE